MAEFLVIGSGGQLGRSLVALLGPRAVGLPRSALDIRDRRAVAEALRTHAPRVVIHAAAATDVDACERDGRLAWEVNAQGTAHVAEACAAIGSWMLYVSTDYVFDGHAETPYPPQAPVHPLSAYGRSKAAGELAVQCLLPQAHWIVRTSWVFAPYGHNFPLAILRQALESEQPLRVVADQRSTPTYAPDLARWLLALVERGKPGLYHAANEGVCSREEFAREILRQAGLGRTVVPIGSGEAGRPAPRPAYSALDCQGTAAVVGPLRPYTEAVADFLAALGPLRPAR